MDELLTQQSFLNDTDEEELISQLEQDEVSTSTKSEVEIEEKYVSSQANARTTEIIG